MTLIHEPDLDSFSEYENNFFFLLAYVLVLCLKGFFVVFVFWCIQIFCSLYFLSLTLFKGNLAKH